MLDAISVTFTRLRVLHHDRRDIVSVYHNYDHLGLWDSGLFDLLTPDEMTVLFNVRGEHYMAVEAERNRRAAMYMNPYGELGPEITMPSAGSPPVSETDKERIQQMAVALDKGKKFHMRELKKNPKCCICLEKTKLYQVYCELPCGHAAFHHRCLSQMLARNNTCPLCRGAGVPSLTPVQIATMAAAITMRHNERTGRRRTRRAAAETVTSPAEARDENEDVPP